MRQAVAIAHPNIAFIKYWGDRNARLRIPANNSISMNLEGLFTTTQVSIAANCTGDEFVLNDKRIEGFELDRVVAFLSQIRNLVKRKIFFRVISENNFPISAGIASSASGFASLALAATSICDLNLNQAELSRLARLGSGSACRSIPEGFVEWIAGNNHENSYAYSLAPADHWELSDCIAIVDLKPKITSSKVGHAMAPSSPFYRSRLKYIKKQVDICKQAIISNDFDTLALIVELDSIMMHAVMMTSNPPLFYWQPETISIIKTVREWQREGIQVCCTIDAGPNVHILCHSSQEKFLIHQLEQMSGVIQIICAKPGGPARLLE